MRSFELLGLNRIMIMGILNVPQKVNIVFNRWKSFYNYSMVMWYKIALP